MEGVKPYRMLQFLKGDGGVSAAAQQVTGTGGQS